MNNEHLATDLETLFVEIITEERILRLNVAIEKFTAEKMTHFYLGYWMDFYCDVK